jgi:hypothetical protein
LFLCENNLVQRSVCGFSRDADSTGLTEKRSELSDQEIKVVRTAKKFPLQKTEFRISSCTFYPRNTNIMADDDEGPQIALPSPQSFLISDPVQRLIWEKFYSFGVGLSETWDQFVAEKDEKADDIAKFADEFFEAEKEKLPAGFTANQVKKILKCGVYTGPRDASGLRDGQAARTVLPNGDAYIGDYSAGKRAGVGVYMSFKGVLYAGQYTGGMKDGVGVQSLPDGSEYSGSWQADIKQGTGVMRTKDGAKYAGQWSKGDRNGFGVLYLPDGAQVCLLLSAVFLFSA